jgi:hypothetical protein
MGLLDRTKEAPPAAVASPTPTRDFEFDKVEQVEKVEGVLLEDERIIGVFDDRGWGDGFVGITNRRLIYYNKSLTAKSKVIESIPWRSVATVGALDKGRFARGHFGSSELIVKTVGGEELHLIFRTSDKAHRVHGLIAQHIV